MPQEKLKTIPKETGGCEAGVESGHHGKPGCSAQRDDGDVDFFDTDGSSTEEDFNQDPNELTPNLTARAEENVKKSMLRRRKERSGQPEGSSIGLDLDQDIEMEVQEETTNKRIVMGGKRKQEEVNEQERNIRRKVAGDQNGVGSGVNRQQNKQSLPNNRMLISQDIGTIVIIQPTGENARSAFASPTKFCKAFQESVFQKLAIKEIRTNVRKSVFTVQVKSREELERIDLAKITKIGEWTVSCYIPNREKVREGVITPIDLEEDLERLKEWINEGSQQKVTGITRLRKRVNGELVPSASIRVTFEGVTLPDVLAIGYIKYRVRPYVYSPLQCYACQRIGHTAIGCVARKRCMICSETHSMKECPNKTREKCANCHQQHKANSAQCQIMKNAYEIERLRAKGVPYEEARRTLMNQKVQRQK